MILVSCWLSGKVEDIKCWISVFDPETAITANRRIFADLNCSKSHYFLTFLFLSVVNIITFSHYTVVV